MASREFGALLATVRHRAGLTQAQLAEIVGMDRAQLAGYESGAVDPGATQLLKIARALDLDVLGEAVPRDEPRWAAEFRERLDRIEEALGRRKLAGGAAQAVAGQDEEELG